MSEDYKFETLCLHAGQQPDPTTTARGVPVHRTSSYVFKSTEHAANLFGIKELPKRYGRDTKIGIAKNAFTRSGIGSTFEINALISICIKAITLMEQCFVILVNNIICNHLI